MIDNIFGNLIEPGDRLTRHLESLSGIKHFHRRSPLDPIPGQPITLTVTTGGPHSYDSVRCYYTLDGSDPTGKGAAILELEPLKVDWDELAWGYFCTWTVDLPAQTAKTLIRYLVAAHQKGDGSWVYADSGSTCAREADFYSLWVDDDPVPAWTRGALVYQVFLDRFYPGDGKKWNKVNNLGDFFGGTLRGVIDKLDYIQSLGFTTIWLSPFFKSTSHHGYNGSDYYIVEPRLGTNDDVKELIEKAHLRGMTMIMDFVANHWSKDHPSFQDAQKDPDSPYHDWYTWRQWPDDYESYFNVKELPKLNLRPGPARDYLLAVARYWLQEGFDGYRLDFAYGPSLDFWVDFKRACREVKPDCWIFGEVVHTAEVQRSYTGIMDGTLDFLLARALRETIAFEHMSLTEFEAFLARHEAFFPADFSRPSFLDNHDMSRFLYICGGDRQKLKLGALLLYTLSGPPIVYNGTEAGVSQERPMLQGKRYVFEEARLPMKWDAEADIDLIEFFRLLAHLRAAHPVLWTGKRRFATLDEKHKIYAYTYENETEKVLVAVNLGQEFCTIQVPGNRLESAHDQLFGSEQETVEGELKIMLNACSGAFICS
jgi:cyclomaltodextrinase